MSGAADGIALALGERMRNALGLAVVLVASTAAAAPARTGRSAKPKLVHPTTHEVAVRDDADDADDTDDVLRPRATAEVRTPTRARSKPKRELYFRAGIAHVEPRTKSGGMELVPVGITQLMPTQPPEGGIVTDAANVITAILGFAPAAARGHVAFETLIGIPKKSKLRATGELATTSLAPTALDLIPTGVPPLGEEIGEVSVAPLMITAVARTGELGGRVRLYAGGGPVVLVVRDAKVTNAVLTEVATPRIETKPALGVVAQIGVDLKLFGNIYARLDLKEMWFQPTQTEISNIHVKTTIPLLETVEVGSARSQVQANPIVVQLGVGASF